MFARKHKVCWLTTIIGNRIPFRIPESVFIHAGIDGRLHILTTR